MIKINLLPLEKRKPERPPLARYGLVLVNAGLVAAVVLIMLGSWYQIAAVNAETVQARDDLQKLQADVRKHDKLMEENQRLTKDATLLQQILDKRSFEFWRVLDAIADVVQANPKVWLDEISVLDAKVVEQRFKTADPASTVKASYGILMKCHVGGLDAKSMTAFRIALKENPTIHMLFPLVNFETEWVVEEQKDFLEKFSLQFEVTLVNQGERLPKTAAPTPEAKP
ncbi:MAG: hypothetical protein HY716_17955 [Planctomycetes bacterium]|nr:hypothetical protein [Planctomycetota bacterium]